MNNIASKYQRVIIGFEIAFLVAVGILTIVNVNFASYVSIPLILYIIFSFLYGFQMLSQLISNATSDSTRISSVNTKKVIAMKAILIRAQKTLKLILICNVLIICFSAVYGYYSTPSTRSVGFLLFF